MAKYKDNTFTLLNHHQVPNDNAGSESAIRNIKDKQKYRVSLKLNGELKFRLSYEL